MWNHNNKPKRLKMKTEKTKKIRYSFNSEINEKKMTNSKDEYISIMRVPNILKRLHFPNVYVRERSSAI